jgi:hypothetical protein
MHISRPHGGRRELVAPNAMATVPHVQHQNISPIMMPVPSRDAASPEACCQDAKIVVATRLSWIAAAFAGAGEADEIG